MQLSINPNTDEISAIGSDGNENRNADVSGDSQQKVIPITNKILLCSPNEGIAKRWHESLSEVGELTVVSSREMLISNLKTYQTDVVLVDLELFNKDYREIPQLLYLISHGVKGYCNRYISKALLVKAVELVRMGEVWVGRSLLFKLMSRLSSVSPPKGEDQARESDRESTLSKLTDREREIAQLVGSGDSNKVIAKKLDITERTVKAHLSSIFRKTSTKDRLQLGLLINS
ncbi:MAG: response regulator transcription factor [Candidatus Thiodiazotropha endolucinida]